MIKFDVEMEFDEYRAFVANEALTHVTGRLLEEQMRTDDAATRDMLSRFWVALTNIHIKIVAKAKEEGVKGV